MSVRRIFLAFLCVRNFVNHPAAVSLTKAVRKESSKATASRKRRIPTLSCPSSAAFSTLSNLPRRISMRVMIASASRGGPPAALT